jgi:predicted ATP-grasp superfamily ATP-dependent carboligase
VRPSERLLRELAFTGLIELEYKLDPRDHRFKLLDMNPRVWGWHTLCGRAGVDFPYLLWLHACGASLPRTVQKDGVSWLRLSTDTPTAVREMLGGRLSVREYLRTLRGPRESAIFARDDPLPGLVELPLLGYVLARRVLSGAGV